MIALLMAAAASGFPQQFRPAFASYPNSYKSQAHALLNFCIKNPNQCSISVNHLTGGWEKHYNANRLNVLASTVKLVPLIAYGSAVASGALAPDTMVDREQWARFWTPFDGGAFIGEWADLGFPQSISLDTMAHGMILWSDNAAHDYFLDLLGRGAMKAAIQDYMPGYVDVPKAINSMFIDWFSNPLEPTSGHRLLGDYSGFEVNGYQRELDQMFLRMKDPEFMKSVRAFGCYDFPWAPQPNPCVPGFAVNAFDLSKLEEGYFTESNTRTYTRLMSGLLERNLLPPSVQSVIEPHLDLAFNFPHVRSVFRRYGEKGGSLASALGYGVLTNTAYLETADNAPGSTLGTRVAVTIHLRGAGLGTATDVTNGIYAFPEVLALDPVFAELVRKQLPDDAPQPDLIARVSALDASHKSSGDTLDMKLDVRNVGTAATGQASTVALYVSGDSALDASDTLLGTATVGPLAAGAAFPVEFHFHNQGALNGKFAILVVDCDNRIAESDEGNNSQYQRIRVP